MEINGETKLACLLGHPVGHSFSPYIHNFLARHFEQDITYLCFDIEPDQIQVALEGLRALHVLGCNVTIPHKIAVMPYLDEIETNAKIIGAVNTIQNDNGKLIGYNTDSKGFMKSLVVKGHSVIGKHVMLLGAGGAAHAIAVELASSGISELTICNPIETEALATLLKAHFPTLKVNCRPLEVTTEQLETVDFLVNATPMGMHGTHEEEMPIDKALVPPKDLVVCDIIYTPHHTNLLKWALSHHLQVVYGIDMLIYQALSSFEIWTGLEVDCYEAVYKLLKDKKVI